MGRRGPAPKPTALKELEGNPGKRPLNAAEPKPSAERPSLPRWLSKEAKTEWRRIVPELSRLGLLTLVDRTALAAYCQAHAELVEATKVLEKEGRLLKVPILATVKTKDPETGKTIKEVEVVGHAVKQHPAVRLQHDAFTRVKQFVSEFGLTPSSRSRLQAPDPPEGPDPFEELLRRAGSRN